MAGSISHVVFAEIFFKTIKKTLPSRELIVGTLLPDIRYLNVITRSATHKPGASIDQIKKVDDFTAGLLLHSYIDEKRETFVKAEKVYDLLPESQNVSIALKLVEDIYLFKQSNYWQLYQTYLQDVLSQEVGFGITPEIIIKWHAINRQYFSGKSQPRIMTFLQSRNFNEQRIQQVIDYIKTIQDKKIVEGYLGKFVEIIENDYKN